MWAAAAMSVAVGVFLPQEAALLQDHECPLPPLDLPLAPQGEQALQAAEALEAAPEAEAHAAAPEKISNPVALFSDISRVRGERNY